MGAVDNKTVESAVIAGWIIMKYFEAHSVYEYKDINGEVPEILLVDGNRTGGKTTAFSRMLVNDFLEKEEKFFLVYRYKNDLANVAEAFFKDIKVLFFNDHELTCTSHANGTYFELFLDSKSCGYASSLTMSGKLKRYSHIFSDVSKMFFDEYQDENNMYLPDEVNKLMSLHTTIARGRGQAVRFVPLYMASNSISIFNPYYSALGITGKINSKTKVLKGEGFVLLRLIIKDVAEAQKSSAFNRAFMSSGYLDSSIDNCFLNDDTFNVVKQKNYGNVFFIFYCSGELFSVFRSDGSLYCKKGGDKTVYPCFGAYLSDRNESVSFIRNTSYWTFARMLYQEGQIFFDSIETKHAFLTLIS